MTAKKSFLIILRLVFVLFSLQFVSDAFYKWDGYSFYMRFIDFLPDLSLAFIIWTIIGVVLASALWLIIYGIFKIISKFLIAVHFEHIVVWFIVVVFSMIIKVVFFGHISLSKLTGLSHFTSLIVAGVSAAIVIWFGRRYIEKILYGLDSRITPLIWLFAVLLVLALPFSILFEKELSGTKRISDSRAHVTSVNEKRPNIILVTMDALTALDMQVYGYERPTTPFISEWAKDAIVFNKAYSSSNWTSSSVMSLMTGQRPWTHMVWHFVANRQKVSVYEENFPRVLKDSGYAVYGFVQNSFAHPQKLGIWDAFLIKDRWYTFRLSSGWWFDKLARFFVNRPIVREWIFETNLITKLINSFRPPVYTTLVPSEMVYNRFLEYISQTEIRKSQRPFFAWLFVYPPHDPYLPPKPYMGMFGDAEKFNLFEKQKESGLLYKEYKPERQADMDILRKRYDEFILYSDKQFELFLSRLAEIIDISNTIIILSSDHGESFSHGYQGHTGPHFYEPFVRIPLIVKMPGKIKSRAIDMPVELTDIAPTILELAGIHVPAWMEGQSLFPLLKGKTVEPQPVFSMQFSNNRKQHSITKGTIAVWDGDYKLIHYLEDKKTLLFNLRYDPDETEDISHQKPDVTRRLLTLINDNLSHANARITHLSEK